MTRAGLALLVVSACLDPGTSLYQRNDTTPPQVLFDLMMPPILGSDGGVPTIAPGARIDIPFSEPMDPQSLRPGILIRKNPERNEIPLVIQVPATPTIPYVVHVLPGDMSYISGTTYTLQLRSLLIDLAGNPLPDGPELTGFFRVQ
jgi:hypothetical protein